jgi:hypothetical protein
MTLGFLGFRFQVSGFRKPLKPGVPGWARVVPQGIGGPGCPGSIWRRWKLVWGSGFGKTKKLGFRVQVSGFRIQDSGFRIQDSGFRIQDSGFRRRVVGLAPGYAGRDWRVTERSGGVRGSGKQPPADYLGDLGVSEALDA